MQVISRRANQSIQIGDDIVVTVLKIRGNQVRLGIFSEEHIPNYWEETLVCEPHSSSDFEPVELSLTC